jgi:peptide/nickel transport system permease protein
MDVRVVLVYKTHHNHTANSKPRQGDKRDGPAVIAARAGALLMGAYLTRRLLALIPTLLLASIIVFVTIRLIPGDVIDLMLSQNDVAADKMSRDQIVAALGLDRPMHTQYLSWIGGIALRGDLGHSLWQNTPVTELLAARLPVTFELGLLALIVALTIALPIGTYSALRQDTAGDYIGRSFSILLLAVPSFWLGTVVMVFPSIWWGWSPEVHYARFLDDPVQNLKNMAVPAIVLGAGLSAVTMRLMRTMMLEVLRQDYIRTAWAKGLPERLVVLRHALRNALVPVITLVGLQAPLLIGGAVIVETIFVIPGMGLLLLEAVNQRDYPIITGVFLVVGVAITLINLLIDMSYGVLDPKVRYR